MCVVVGFVFFVCDVVQSESPHQHIYRRPLAPIVSCSMAGCVLLNRSETSLYRFTLDLVPNSPPTMIGGDLRVAKWPVVGCALTDRFSTPMPFTEMEIMHGRSGGATIGVHTTTTATRVPTKQITHTGLVVYMHRRSGTD